MKKFILLILAAFVTVSAQDAAKFPEIVRKLQSIADVKIKTLESADSTLSLYEVTLLQPLDHLNPNSGKKFGQRIFWFHRDASAPTTLVTEGYSAAPRIYETTVLTKGNQLSVEHRFFGKSVPDSLDWRYLNTAQAAADHHRIFEIFSRLYSGKWISTGISKGGQTTILYKYYYPDDMDVWVPYVAPLNFEREDSRIHGFLNTVGSDDCRHKILEFQRALLSDRDEIIPLLKTRAEKKGYTFPISIDSVYEYAVFEYPFAFWQWGNSKCEDIPAADSAPEKLFEHLYTASPFDYFDAESMTYFAPFFYQAYTEMGYYNYDTKPFKDLLKAVHSEYASNIIFCPEKDKVIFNPEIMKNVYSFLLEKGNNVLYIYGGLDTWSAASVVPGDKTNAVKMVLKDGHHSTRIHSFGDAQKRKIYSTLSKWLGIDIPAK